MRGRATLRGALLVGGSMWLLAAGGVGCEPDPGVPEDYCEPGPRPAECCQLCPGAAERGYACELPAPPWQFRNISETWEAWAPACRSGPSASSENWGRAVAGHCGNGLSFVSFDQGLGGVMIRYFDASGAFIALEYYHDVIDEPCGGHYFWPKPVECPEMRGTVSCGAYVQQ